MLVVLVAVEKNALVKLLAVLGADPHHKQFLMLVLMMLLAPSWAMVLTRRPTRIILIRLVVCVRDSALSLHESERQSLCPLITRPVSFF